MSIDGVKPMHSFEDCVGKKIKEIQQMNKEFEKDRQQYKQAVFAEDAATIPEVEAREIDSLEVVKSRVFGRQGIIYVEKNENPETIKWYFSNNKIKFDTELEQEDLLKVLDLMLSRG